MGFITSRGYRAWKSRPVSARSLRDEILVEEEVRRIHQENYSVYAIRTMWHAMRDGTRAETRWHDGWRSAELICSKRIWESVRDVELATMGRGHW